MRIVQSDLSLDSTHQFSRQTHVREQLELWAGSRRQTAERDTTRVSLSNEGQQAAARERPVAAIALASASETPAAQTSAPTTAATPTGDTEAVAQAIDPKFELLIALVERLTGRRIKVLDSTDLQGSVNSSGNGANSSGDNGAASAQRSDAAAGWGAVYRYERSYTESETTTVTATGTVRTADGQDIAFDVSLTMSRQYAQSEQFEFRAGDAQKKDPLILNFAGNAAELTDQRFAFDIDADGTQDRVALATGASGFLVLDRNRNGRVDNGQELFGALSGDGFSELAALDDDGNGWIDESDAAYDQLQIWRKQADGKDQLRSLAASGVGAIALSRIATPYDIKDSNNALRASVAASSIWLGDDGAAGTVQKIDLAV